MASRRLVLSFTAPLFTAICDQAFVHRPVLVFAHIAYYASSAFLTRLNSLAAVSVVILLREAFVSGCEPLLNNAALATIDDNSYQHNQTAFGSLRFYGSLGWGISSTLGPIITEYFFNGNLLTLLDIQVLLGIPVVLLIMFSVDLSPELFQRQAARLSENEPPSEAQPSDNSALELSPLAIHAGLVAVTQGATLGALQTTSFIYFTSIPISPSALGIAVTLSCAAEAVLFFFDAPVIEMLGGSGATFILSAAANAFSLVLYTLVQFAPSPAIAFMLVEVFCGAAHALFLSAALDVAAKLAPPNRSSTAQGTLSSLLYGLGPAIGAFIAGISYEQMGAPMSYLILSVVQFIVTYLPYAFGVDLYQAELGSAYGNDGEEEGLLSKSGRKTEDVAG